MKVGNEGKILFYELFITDSFRQQRIYCHDSIFGLQPLVEMLTSAGIKVHTIRTIMQVPMHDTELEELVKKHHAMPVVK